MNPGTHLQSMTLYLFVAAGQAQAHSLSHTRARTHIHTRSLSLAHSLCSVSRSRGLHLFRWQHPPTRCQLLYNMYCITAASNRLSAGARTVAQAHGHTDTKPVIHHRRQAHAAQRNTQAAVCARAPARAQGRVRCRGCITRPACHVDPSAAASQSVSQPPCTLTVRARCVQILSRSSSLSPAPSSREFVTVRH